MEKSTIKKLGDELRRRLPIPQGVLPEEMRRSLGELEERERLHRSSDQSNATLPDYKLH